MVKLIAPPMFPKWRTPSAHAFTPEGVTLGAEVFVDAGSYLPAGEPYRNGIYRRPESLSGLHVRVDAFLGQVWSKAPQPRHWWIVAEDGAAYAVHERDIEVLGRCVDTPLPLEVAS